MDKSKGKNQLIVIKENSIFKKIRLFIKSLLNKNVQHSGATTEYKEISSKQDFLKTIQIENESDNPEILELQKQYEENGIAERELTTEQTAQLEELYRKQIKSLKETLAIYKQKISNFNT